MTTVLATRLKDAERAQVEAAARRIGLTVAAFARQALLAASARIEGKAMPRSAVEAEAVSELDRVVVLGSEPERVHYVDGEPVRRAGSNARRK